MDFIDKNYLKNCLKDILLERPMDLKSFGREIGIGDNTLRHIFRGKDFSTKTSLIIMKYLKGLGK